MPVVQGTTIAPDGSRITLDASLRIVPSSGAAGYVMGVTGASGSIGGGGTSTAYRTFDIRNYGPALNGSTEDTASWMAAAAAAKVAGGGVVTWEEGGGSVSIVRNLLLPSGVGLALGPSCTLRLSPDAVDGDFLIGNEDFDAGNADISIEGGTYDGNSAAFAYGDNISTFQFRNVSRLRLSNLTVTGGPAEGAYMYLCTDVLLSGVRADTCGIIDGVDSDGSGVHFDTCSRIRFTGLQCTNNGFHGLFVRGCTGLRGDVQAAGNHIDGVRVYGSFGVDIDYNTPQNTRNGFYAAGDAGVVNYGCTFRGNSVENGANNVVANFTYDCSFFGNAVDAGENDVYFTENTDALYFFGHARTVLNDGPATNSINLGGSPPAAHAPSHEAGGGDEIDLNSIAGRLDASKLDGGATLETVAVTDTLETFDLIINNSFEANTGTFDLPVHFSAAAPFVPFTTTSAVMVANLNADLLDGEHGAYHLSRANHTGTQDASTVSDFAEAVQDAVGAMATDSSSVDFTYDDTTGTLTATVITEAIQDIIGALLSGSTNIAVTYNDAANTLTVSLPSTLAGTITFSGAIVGTTMRQGTADGSDSSSLSITGGGAVSASRGAYVMLHGNEHANTGELRLAAGGVAPGGDIVLYTGTTSTERLRITAAGLIAFFGGAGSARGSAYTQTYATADKTHAARTAAALTDSVAGVVSTTLATIPDPADSPATADALRDDLAANALVKIRNAISSLADQVNKLRADQLDTAQALNSVIDDLQAFNLVG